VMPARIRPLRLMQLLKLPAPGGGSSMTLGFLPGLVRLTPKTTMKRVDERQHAALVLAFRGCSDGPSTACGGGNFSNPGLSWTMTRNRVRTLIRDSDRLAETSHG